MSECNESSFSANFRLYAATGLAVQFTVRAATADEHLGRLAQYLATLGKAGYTVELPGLEAGEEIEMVDAWVLGETSKDEPCVYLYSSRLQYRIATVYLERIGDLSFPVATSGVNRWPGAAPTREIATAKKYLHPVEPFEIVLAPSGKMTDAGKPVMKFSRLHKANRASWGPSGRPETQASVTNGATGTDATPAPKLDTDTPKTPGAPPVAPGGKPTDAELAEEFEQIPGAPPRELLVEFNRLGVELYAEGWDAQKSKLIDTISTGKAKKATELNEREIKRLIAGMNAKLSQQRQPDALGNGRAK